MNHLMRQQSSILELWMLALSRTGLSQFIHAVLAAVTQILEVQLVRVFELLPNRTHLLLRYGIGWHEECVGRTVVGMGRDSLSGYTLMSGTAVIVEDLAKETRFCPPPLMLQHGVVSSVSAVIQTPDGPFGVLGVDSTTPRKFLENDVYYIQMIANLIGTVISHQQVETQMRECIGEVRTVFETAPIAIVSFDLLGNVLEWNPAAESLFGWIRDEVRGRPYPAVPEGAWTEFQRLLRRKMAGERLRGLIVRRVNKAGKPIDLSVYSTRLVNSEGKPIGFVSFYTDMTERNQFLRVASHELGNPLSTIKAISKLMSLQAPKYDMPDQFVSKFQTLTQEIDKLSVLFHRIFQAFRIQEGGFSLDWMPVDVLETIESALRASSAKTHHSLLYRGVAESSLWVSGDATWLKEVWMNLLSNAAKYSDPGSEILVRVEIEQSHVRICVRDQGVGVPESELIKVFDAFYRASNVTAIEPGGIGLGLYVCHEVVERHGGKIWAENNPDIGATFWVELPLAR